MLDGLMFDNSLFSPFLDVFLRAKASVRPRIFDLVVMYELVKGDAFGFIVKRRTKDFMVLCGSCTLQQTKTSICATHTTPYSPLCVSFL